MNVSVSFCFLFVFDVWGMGGGGGGGVSVGREKQVLMIISGAYLFDRINVMYLCIFTTLADIFPYYIMVH